ncbi:MAG: hypothetical protein KatS3mg103_0415 [Phycisphaerales bacterium]|nr:MAG: hypothetical protein KatS3mg103_0415 [Phycisphaerales bacterium]
MPGDRLAEDPPERPLPDPRRIVQGVPDAAMPAPGWLFIATQARGQQVETLWQRVQEAIGDAAPYVVFVGHGVDVHNLDQAMFHFLASMDPGRDRLAARPGLRTVAFDATPKAAGTLRGQAVRPWPPVIEPDRSVLERLAPLADGILRDTREFVASGTARSEGPSDTPAG